MIQNNIEYEEYKNNFIKKWKPIFANSENKYKTYRLNYSKIAKDFEPLFEYAIFLYFSDKHKNLVNIKEVIEFE